VPPQPDGGQPDGGRAGTHGGGDGGEHLASRGGDAGANCPDLSPEDVFALADGEARMLAGPEVECCDP